MKDRPSEQWANMSEERKEKHRQRISKWRKGNQNKAIHLSAKSRAKRNGIKFDLEFSDIVIPEFCPVLGIKLKQRDGKLADNSPSLDRIIPELGYVKGNVLVVSNKANRIKNNATVDELCRLAEFYFNLVKERKLEAA